MRTPQQELVVILSRAIRQSPNAILIARADGVIEYVNPSFTQLTGYTLEDVTGGDPTFFSVQGLSGQAPEIPAVLSEGRDWRGEIRGGKKNGEAYWALQTITPITFPEERVTHFLIIQQDITQQKLDRQALEESEERFRQVAEMTGEWLWEQDQEGRYLYSSAAVRDILGYEPEEIIGRRYFDFLAKEERANDVAGLPTLVGLGQGYCRLINCYVHKEGHKVYTESTGEPLLDDQGRVIKWRGVDHNITHRKRYEDELRLRNRAIEAASVGISIFDATSPGSPIIYVNSALCQMTGYHRDELIGRNLELFQGADTDPAAVEELATAIQQGEGCNVTLKNYRKDGTWFWNQLLISPVREEGDRLTHYIGIQSDVTEQRRAEEQQRDLDFAKKIQTSLLPKAPLNLPDVQVFGVCVPASHVGGDYFDYFQVRDYLDIVIADVSGHNLGSALMMAEARSSLKAEARRAKTRLREDHGPGESLRVLNELLFEDLDGADTFISMFYLRYNPKSRHLRFANAGHNQPLFLTAGAALCEPLDADGMIFGIKRDVFFEEKSLFLAPGDRLLLYTDGIVETCNEAGEFLGIHRLCQLFASNRSQTPQEVVEEILSAVCAFRGKAVCEDDITLIVAQAI